MNQGFEKELDWGDRGRGGAEVRSPEVINQLEGVVSFDAKVLNGDRTAQKPNLLVQGNQLLLIDHSLALPVHIPGNLTRDPNPLLPEKQSDLIVPLPP